MNQFTKHQGNNCTTASLLNRVDIITRLWLVNNRTGAWLTLNPVNRTLCTQHSGHNNQKWTVWWQLLQPCAQFTCMLTFKLFINCSINGVQCCTFVPRVIYCVFKSLWSTDPIFCCFIPRSSASYVLVWSLTNHNRVGSEVVVSCELIHMRVWDRRWSHGITTFRIRLTYSLKSTLCVLLQ